jgi:DNA modification methylase
MLEATEVVSFQPNTIYCGDCKDVLRHFPENCVDLIYLDPPFFSNQDYEIIWEDGYEMRSFADRWKGGIKNYVGWMEERLKECHRVLKENGTLYLHCDWHAGHYLKVMMDERVFGENRLINDIIWKRTSAHTGEGKITKFGTVHDNILVYTKTDKYTFNPQYQPFDKTFIEKFYKNVDTLPNDEKNTGLLPT